MYVKERETKIANLKKKVMIRENQGNSEQKKNVQREETKTSTKNRKVSQQLIYNKSINKIF